MVAKKTAVQQSASGRSMGAAGDPGAASAETVPTKTASTKKASTKKAPTKKAPTKKARTTTVAARTASAGTVDAKTASGRTASSERTAASKEMAASAKKAVGGAAPAKTAGTRPVSAKAGKAAGKAADKSAAPVKRAPRKATAAKGARTARKAVASAADGAAAQAAETTGATTVVAKKTSGTAAAADKPTAVPKARVAAAEPGELAVRPGEDPWTPEEAAEAREELLSEALRLRAEITHSEESLAGLMRDSGDGAGDDQADTGTKNITRESEMALAANAREMLEQTERALERLDAGTYGLCENCGNAIGKARMQAFPRATLCVECKQKQERRY
ncbi:TraR/DksA C4-type zinc finger protein [Streptomyces tauricus]|uniref:TraR/DksA C4-type zinc finger protein n=1 Tax=Streptomyces tauricus TaxID=68274 RepID=A0ABZ1JQ28_9ACTN|nr:TraR/DksA C4-type zinc finger protein [Streptomyces tauricus]